MICVFISLHLMANGGGVAYFGVNGSGNPHFREITDVSILREDLLIRPESERIFVRATYLLENNISRQFHYAFPVDFWVPANEDERELLSASIENSNQYIRNVGFWCDGHSLEYVSEEPQLLETENEHSCKMRIWYYTTIVLKEGVSELSVSYELQNESFEEHPFYGDVWKNATFTYDFTPAATFGDGIIKEFSVVIDESDETINKEEYHEEQDYHYYSGEMMYKFEKQGRRYVLDIADFDLKDVNPLLLQFTYNDIDAEVLSSNDHASHFVTRISSETSLYPPSNLSDLDFNTVCVIEGGEKQIEINSESGQKAIEWIYFLNGNYESEEAYYNHNRIKKAFVEWYDDDEKLITGDTLEFEDKKYRQLSHSDFAKELVSFGGLNYDYSYYVDYLMHHETESYEDDFHKVEVMYTEEGVQCATLYIRYAKKAVITILDEYKGAKFDKTCISEIFVIGADFSTIHL